MKQWGSFEGQTYPTVDPQEEKGGSVWWHGPAWGRRQTFRGKKRVGKKQKPRLMSHSRLAKSFRNTYSVLDLSFFC